MGLYVTELYLNIPLEIKQVNSLPVTAIQGQNIPCLYRGKKCKCAVNMKKKIKLSGDPATVCSFEKQHSVPGGEATGNSSQQGGLGWHQKHLQGPGIPHNSEFQFPQPRKRCPGCFHSLGMCSCEPGECLELGYLHIPGWNLLPSTSQDSWAQVSPPGDPARGSCADKGFGFFV